jgi:teichuronic acid exporter
MMDTLGNRTIKGLSWNFTKVMGQSILQFVVNVVLARLISPQEFGLLGLTVIFTGLATIFSNLGMGSAIIQRKELTPEHTRTAMTVSLILGCIICGVFWILSPLIALFLNRVELVLLLRVISLQFFISGLTNVSLSLLMRSMQFKTIFFIEFISYLIGNGLTSITLALNGFGVWSIVWGNLVYAVISSVLFAYFSKIPKRLLIRKDKFKELIGFGGGVSAISLLNYTANNVDYFVIGKMLSPFKLGIYTQAFQLMRLPLVKIAQTISSVLMASYSEIQSDIARIRNSYLISVNAVSLIAFPLLIGMAVDSEYIMLGIYGDKWAGSIPILRILCIAGLFKVIFNVAGPVVQATGNVYKELIRQFIYAVLLTIGSIIGVRFGIEGVAAAVVIASIWLYASMAQLVLSILNIKWIEFFKAQSAGFLVGSYVFMANILFIRIINITFPFLTPLIKLFLLVFISAITYFLSIIFLPKSVRGELPGQIAKRIAQYLPNGLSTRMSKMFVD